jgi:hypothetical protein
MPDLGAPSPALSQFVGASEPSAQAPSAPSAEAAPIGAASGALQDFVKEDTYGTPGQMLATGAEGLARGASLGLSDQIETGLGVDPKEIKNRMDVNPVLSTGTQVLGGAGLLGLTGGAAAPIEEALGGGALARAVGFGVEGAGFGAGNAVTEQALGDPNLTAQKVLADIGMGAAFGSGMGALSKGVEAVLPKAAQKLSDGLGSLKDLAVGSQENPGLLVKAASFPGAVASGTSPSDWAQSFYDGLNRPDAKVSIRALSKNLSDIGSSAKEAVTQLYEEAQPANISHALENMPVEDAQTIGKNIVEKISGVENLNSGVQKIVEERLGQLNSNLADATSAYDVHSALDDFAKDLDKGKLIKFDTLPTASQMEDQTILKGIRSTVRGALSDPEVFGSDAAMHYSNTSGAYRDYLEAFKNFRQSFMKKEVGSGTFIVDPTKVQSFFNRFNDVSQDLKKQYLNAFLEQAGNVSKLSENYHGYQAGEDSISSRISELATKNQEFSKVAEALKANAKSPISGLTGDVLKGAFAHTLGVPTPVVGAAVAGLEAYKAIKNPYELGASLSNTVAKLQAIGDISSKVSEKLGTLSRGIFISHPASASVGPLTSVRFATNAGYDKNIKRVNELASNPDLFLEHLQKQTEAIHEAAPGVSQGISQTMTAAAAFLQSKIPQTQGTMPLSTKAEVPLSAKVNFNEYYKAVDDPSSVLADVKRGTLTPQAMEALQAVHPQFLQEMRKTVIENLKPEKAKTLSYPVKLSLSQFLGEPLDESMVPSSILSNQMTFNSPSTSQQSTTPRKGKSTVAGLKELSLASRSLTETQDLGDAKD